MVWVLVGARHQQPFIVDCERDITNSTRSRSLKLVSVGIFWGHKACFQQGSLNYPDWGNQATINAMVILSDLPTVQFLGWKYLASIFLLCEKKCAFSPEKT